MTELLSAARLLGLGTPAHPLVSELDYLDLVDHGLPVRSLERIAAVVAPTDTSFRYRIVPKASLARRKAGRRLSTAQSVIVARLKPYGFGSPKAQRAIFSIASIPCWAQGAQSISYWRMRSARSLCEAFSADWNMGRLCEGAKA
jgi:hypothetical protein